MTSQTAIGAEYHHFIPQFILKNFAHKFSPPTQRKKHGSRRRKKDQKTNAYPGDLVMNIVYLRDPVPELTESSIKRTFGLTNMYRNDFMATDHNIVEKELSKLESRASTIIANIKNAFESGKTGISMSRQQRDVLRKFMFIMKYRSQGFYKRFQGDDSGNYIADDADKFKAYMKEKGIQSPLIVWAMSIRAILDLEIDLEGKWKMELIKKIYPDDAQWFIVHMEMYFLAFCTTMDPNDEFILTENCYSIHEGPSSIVINPETGVSETVAWTSYHEFSPITPKLMLILRSSMLPNVDEDADPDIKAWRREMYESSRNRHTDPTTAGSTLEDLALKKPRNSYSQVLPQGVVLLPGEDGSRRANHQFTFSFFKLSTNQVKRINSIFLENAYHTSVIGYKSQSFLKQCLECFLPSQSGHKVIYSHPPEKDPSLVYWRKLESIAHSLGSTVTLSYKDASRPVGNADALRKASLEQLHKIMLEHLPEQPTAFMKLYNKLGGNHNTMITDLDQVRIMRLLRIKIDVWTKGYPEGARERVRGNLRDLFCRHIPPRRLWFYLKSCRAMSLGTPDTLKTTASNSDGPEDVIVKVNHMVRPDCLGLLMHFTVMQDIQHKRKPGLNPSSKFELNEAGLQRALDISHLAFSSVGSIRDCGKGTSVA